VQRVALAERFARRPAVDDVAHQRVTDGRQVRADLVAQGPRHGDLDQRQVPDDLHHPIARLGRPRAVLARAGRHAVDDQDTLRVLAVRRDGGVDHAGVRQALGLDHGQVALGHRALPQRRMQAIERLDAACRDQEPRGLRVQAMQDPGLAR